MRPIPACNPYLAFSVMLAAGLKGIDEGYDLPPEATDNIYELTDEERLAEGIGSLPGSLRDALDAMERSELVAEALGEHVFENFLLNKRREWADYKAVRHPVRDRALSRNALRDVLVGSVSDILLVFPDPPPPLLAQTLDLAGMRWKAVGERGGRDAARTGRRLDAARSSAPTTIPKARSRCAARCARATARVESILLLVVGRAAARARAPRRPLRRLLPHAVPSEGARGARCGT